MTVGGLRCDGDCGTHVESSKPYPKGWLRLQARGRRNEQRDDTEMRPIRTVDVCSIKCATKAIGPMFAEVTEPAPDQGQSGIAQRQAGVSAQP